MQDFKAVQKLSAPWIILEKVQTEGFQGKSARFYQIITNPAAPTPKLKMDHPHPPFFFAFCYIINTPDTSAQMCYSTFKI